MKYYVGIDLGGTNIVAGVVNEAYSIVASAKCKTNCPRPAEEIISDMAKVAVEAVDKAGITMEEVEWIGVGSPGMADTEAGVIVYANNLDFYDVPLCDMLEEKLHKKIYIGNDANAAAYGEFMAGAAKGSKSAIAITLGTGVGGGIIIDSKIYTGFNFAGAELGHMTLVANGRQCNCGRKGCYEAYASATALIAFTKEAMLADKASKMWELCDGDIDKVSGRTAFDGLRAGDVSAKAVTDKYIGYFSEGVISIINIFQPEILCVGGGISKEGDLLLDPVRHLLATECYSRFSKQSTKVVTAKLGNDAGVIGAALLGFAE